MTINNKTKILEMLSNGKITIEEATKLLELVDKPEDAPSPASAAASASGKKTPKYLRVLITPEEGAGNEVERVNVRVPMSLIRAGVKLKSIIPNDAASQVDSALKEKGINFSIQNIKDDDIEQLINALDELEVDIEANKQKVKVFTE